jgi:hypothetical protein
MANVKRSYHLRKPLLVDAAPGMDNAGCKSRHPFQHLLQISEAPARASCFRQVAAPELIHDWQKNIIGQL